MDPGNPPSAGRRAAKSASRSKYAPRACQECRRLRAKCDGQKPSCARCLSRGKACVFTSEADNRGSAPKSYVALLQARIKLLEKVLWLHSIDVDASVAQLDAQRTEVDEGPSAAAYSSSIAFNEMCADLEGALYLDEPLCESERPGHEARFFGATSGRLELQASHGCEPESLDMGSSPSTEYQTPETARHPPVTFERDVSMEASGVDDLVTPDLKERLIELYFQWEQPWYQIVDEGIFRHSMQSNGRYSSPLLLCCILAMGSRYSDEPEARADPNDPSTAGRVFAERAEILLRSDIKSPSLTTIQALGVLGIYNVAIGSDSLGWLHHGLANRLLLDLGLNLDSSTVTGVGSLAPEEVRLRRQIYWTLYCSDKLWASYTGRVCTMLDSQGAIPIPPSPRPEESHGNDHSQHLSRLQRAMVTHCQILEKILTNLYAPKRLSSASEKRTFFDSCILTLKGWFYSLPKELKLKTGDASTDSIPSPHACILNMVYHTSVVLLAKPFLPPSKRGASETGTPRPFEQDDVFRRASAACLEAAGEICLLGERYRDAFGSFRRSPLTATHCTLTAALVFMFVQPAASGKVLKGNKTHLNCCMQTLRELSVSWGPSLRYWRTLDRILSRQIPRIVREEGIGSTGSGRVGDATEGFDALDPGSEVPQTSALSGPVEEQPRYGSNLSFPGEPSRVPSLYGIPDLSMAGSGQLWNDATTQLFAEVGHLNVGAFDVLSWDNVNQDTSDFHLWGPGPGNTW